MMIIEDQIQKRKEILKEETRKMKEARHVRVIFPNNCCPDISFFLIQIEFAMF
jgi:hypothetical protein